MAKKLLVKTPQTIDGVNLRYDANKQVVYKHSIVELAARKNFAALNAKLPPQLKHELLEVEVEEAPTGASNDALKRKLESLEKEKENASLLQKIAELEAEKANGFENKETKESTAPGVTPDENDGTKTTYSETATEVISKIKIASSEEEIAELTKGDSRSTVLKAAEARREQLKGE